LQDGLKNGRPWWTRGDPREGTVKSIWWGSGLLGSRWTIGAWDWTRNPTGNGDIVWDLGRQTLPDEGTIDHPTATVVLAYERPQTTAQVHQPPARPGVPAQQPVQAAAVEAPQPVQRATLLPASPKSDGAPNVRSESWYGHYNRHTVFQAPASPRSDGTPNVRSESWYGHYRHTVFQAIYNTKVMGFNEIVVLGVQPLSEMARTCEEFPCLQQDFRDAISQQKAPFFDSAGNQRVAFEQVFFQRETKERLAAFLEFNSTQARATILVSCPQPYMSDAEGIADAHNEKTGFNKVQVFWASTNDVYGGRALRDRSTNRRCTAM